MNLIGKLVLFRLSAEGNNALADVLQSGGSFIARVREQDRLGLWIELQEEEPAGPIRVMLLKWDFLSTALFDLEPEQPGIRERIGFR